MIINRIQVIILLFLFITIPLFGSDESRLQWEQLPPLPPALGKSVQAGVAGPFAGIHNEALIVAGRANFPEPVWQNEKKYHNQIYVLENLSSPDSRLWNQKFKVDRSFAYGASVNTRWGILCMGGRDDIQFYDVIFLLSWDEKNRRIRTKYLPSLPISCAHGYATILDNKVYLAGAQSRAGLENAMTNFWTITDNIKGNSFFVYPEASGGYELKEKCSQ